MTNVKFYIDTDGQILAYFPNLKGDNKGNNTCYAHIGQHSACSPDYVKGLKDANKDQYQTLLNELIGQGYDDLKVMNKETFTDWTLTTSYYNNDVVKCPVWAKSFFNGVVYIQDDKQSFSFTCSFGPNSNASYSGCFFSFGISNVEDCKLILNELLKTKYHNPTKEIPLIIAKLQIKTIAFNASIVLQNYELCAVWASEIDNLSVYEIAPDLHYSFACNCMKFITENETDLIETGLNEHQIGRTLFLTQNRHGSGFFDFPMSKEVETRLTLSAQSLGEINLFAQDGKILGE